MSDLLGEFWIAIVISEIKLQEKYLIPKNISYPEKYQSSFCFELLALNIRSLSGKINTLAQFYQWHKKQSFVPYGIVPSRLVFSIVRKEVHDELIDLGQGHLFAGVNILPRMKWSKNWHFEQKIDEKIAISHYFSSFFKMPIFQSFRRIFTDACLFWALLIAIEIMEM